MFSVHNTVAEVNPLILCEFPEHFTKFACFHIIM